MPFTTPSFPLTRVGLTAGALFFLLLSSGPKAETLTNAIAGSARVVDGDTLDVSGQRIRLEGIDAPELAQSCKDAQGADWPCGREALKYLAELTSGRDVACDSTGTDKYGRVLGICFAEGREINAEMVRSGFAWAFIKYSTAYTSQEAEARAVRAGVWQGPAEAPWDYRHKGWQTAEASAPNGCAIKGNVSHNGRIYHVPWAPWYSKVKVDENRGERWFCSEADALAAGWRAAATN